MLSINEYMISLCHFASHLCSQFYQFPTIISSPFVIDVEIERGFTVTSSQALTDVSVSLFFYLKSQYWSLDNVPRMFVLLPHMPFCFGCLKSLSQAAAVISESSVTTVDFYNRLTAACTAHTCSPVLEMVRQSRVFEVSLDTASSSPVWSMYWDLCLKETKIVSVKVFVVQYWKFHKTHLLYVFIDTKMSGLLLWILFFFAFFVKYLGSFVFLSC